MSRYRNAAQVLPPHLLAALQHYAAGEQLYVPRPAQRLRWGERSGARADLAQRNAEIVRRHAAGASIDQLMAEYHLGYDSVRKIVGGKNGSSRSRG